MEWKNIRPKVLETVHLTLEIKQETTVEGKGKYFLIGFEILYRTLKRVKYSNNGILFEE